jgi:hypothetical protein
MKAKVLAAGNNQQGANQSASAGGLGEGGNDDES